MNLDELAERELHDALTRFGGWHATAKDDRDVCVVAAWTVAVAKMLGSHAAVLSEHTYETHSGEKPVFPRSEMDATTLEMVLQIVRDSFEATLHANR